MCLVSVVPPPIPTRSGIGVGRFSSTPSLSVLGLYPQSNSIRFRGVDYFSQGPFQEHVSLPLSIFWWQYPATLRAPSSVSFTTSGTAIPSDLRSSVVVAGDSLRMYEIRRATPWAIDGFHIRLFQSQGAIFYRRTTQYYTGTMNF